MTDCEQEWLAVKRQTVEQSETISMAMVQVAAAQLTEVLAF